MDYYTEIKQELINNEIYKKVKDYSIEAIYKHITMSEKC